MGTPLQSASEQTLELIERQAEHRLSAQLTFASAADQRASTIAGAATALSGAAVALVVQGISGGKFGPLGAAATTAAFTCGLAAYRAMLSTRSLEFHPLGFRPSDFFQDVQDAKSHAAMKVEILEDYEERLAFNSQTLRQRGYLSDSALKWLARTPALAFTSGVAWFAVSRAMQALFPT